MSEEDMQRTLVAEFPPFGVNVDRDGLIYTLVSTGYTSIGVNVFLNETSIDLSGYALQKKSFYPYSSFEQRNAAVIANFTDQGIGRNVVDNIIISSVPLDLTGVNPNLLAASLPGFIGNTGTGFRLNRDPLIHQHQIIYSHDSTTSGTGGTSIYRVVSSQSASSLEPTAADRLYCYRLITTNGIDGDLTMPAARVMIPGTISTEPSIEYMMRLKRSYELANQV
jgi:hypothetical protein